MILCVQPSVFMFMFVIMLWIPNSGVTKTLLEKLVVVVVVYW